MEILPTTKKYRGNERLIAAFDPTANRWTFSAKEISTFFLYGLEDAWESRIYSDYFRDFWNPVLVALDGKKGPQDIVVHIEYHIGSETEETLQQMMKSWASFDNGYLAVDRPTGKQLCSYVHLRIDGCTVSPLTVDD